MWYNTFCHTNNTTGRFVFPGCNPIVINWAKRPPLGQDFRVPVVRVTTAATNGGRFVMNGDDATRVKLRRAQLRANGGSVTRRQWEMICRTFGNVCVRCGNPELRYSELSVDHIVPVSKGGSGYWYNLQPLCHTCNTIKSDSIIDYRNPLLLARLVMEMNEHDRWNGTGIPHPIVETDVFVSEEQQKQRERNTEQQRTAQLLSVHRAMLDYQNDNNGNPPSIRRIAHMFNIGGSSTAYKIVKDLEARGLVYQSSIKDRGKRIFVAIDNSEQLRRE